MKIELDNLSPRELGRVYDKLIATRDALLEAGNYQKVRLFQGVIDRVRLKLVGQSEDEDCSLTNDDWKKINF